MTAIWAAEVRLRPTGPLTFRQMPSGPLHIMSYPFLPPTTLSGFLERVRMVAAGGDWPGYGADWYAKKTPGFTLTLGPEYRALGAFPPIGAWSIHTTRRHGPKDFKHREFSRIHRDHKAFKATNRNQDAVFQLHHWDYLFCDILTGWVAARTPEPLAELATLTGFGGMAGKEGYLVVESVGEPRECPWTEGKFQPLGLAVPPLRPESGRFFNLYGHHWNPDFEWANGERGGVDGFVPLSGWFEPGPARGVYWQWAEGTGFQADMPDRFLTDAPELFSPREAS